MAQILRKGVGIATALSDMGEIRPKLGKYIPWGTVWSRRFPLCRGGCEGKRAMGKDGPSLVIFQALRHHTGVVLPGCPVLGQ